MTVLTTYDDAALTALERQSATIAAQFRAAGFARIVPPILQPADVFLDRSGEEIRRRTYVFPDPSGEELCLRPDLTIPTMRAFLVGGVKSARLSYDGPVFRYQMMSPDKPAQFLQAGGEILGAGGGPADDAEIMALAVQSLAACGLARIDAKMGDLALFSALVDALSLPVALAARLKRHFWRPDYFRDLLKRLADGGEAGGALVRVLGGLPEPEARAVLRDVFAVAGVKPQGTRSPEEITERFLEKAADASAARLPKPAADMLTRFLDISAAAPDALSQIRALTASAGVSLDAALDRVARRLDLLAQRGLDPARVTFSTQFGRNMEYYTGFVFELWAQDAQGPVQIAGGGRYDNLARALGAKDDIPAAGCAIRTERLLAAVRTQGGVA
jgi:ATP phosphoribosyltransferase regulatory subunit